MSALDELANLDNWRPREQGHGFYHWAYFGNHADVNEAAAELAELRQIADCVDMDECEKRLVELAQLKKRLEIACHVKAKDKVGFDWEVLDTIAQLRAELEMNKANLESFMQLQGEHKKLCDLVAERYKIYLKDQAEMVRLRAALDEARKVILHTFQEHDGCNFAEDWLMAHPEEK